MIFMPQTLWGIFYYVNLIELGREGDGEAKKRQWESAKVKRWKSGDQGERRTRGSGKGAGVIWL